MQDHCPVEATLDLIGGKYKALILWNLSEGKLRFSQLQKRITSATPRMLTLQLRELENQDLIHREVYAEVPPRVEYSMTELGRSLMPILSAMRDWGAEYLRGRDIEPNCFMMDDDTSHHGTSGCCE
jgi:DNA-binding HxlR family transcriptional regulator